jgi:multidrug resistance efflux pump
MSIDIVQLEQTWLQAEAMVDEAKREAVRASDLLQRHNTKVVDAAEAKMLMTSLEQARQRQAEAEKQASAAFDLLWQAQGQGQQSVHA